MKALVLKKKGVLSIENFEINETLKKNDVRIQLKACGICGSDIHYYKDGRIGDFIVKEPMILGHEAAGVITDMGSNVTNLKIGDRVCMEPGIPNFMSKETLEGQYNLDRNVKFWATPPIHGVMRENVVHPAPLTFKLPDNVDFFEGAMVEPLAVGIESAKQANINPGDVGLVIGAGTIGILTAMAALAGGCSKVIIATRSDEKLQIASSYDGIIGINSSKFDLHEKILKETQGEGIDVLFEASGNPDVFSSMFNYCRRGARVVLIGLMNEPVHVDVPVLLMLGLTIKTVFRYRCCFERALLLISSGKIDLTPLISKVFKFKESIEAYKYAAEKRPDTIKVMIDF